ILNLTIALCVERCVRYPEGLLGAVLNAAPITAVGVLSYSLYLWQEPFLNPFQKNALCAFPLNLFLVIGCALLSYYLVEKPFLRLKSRLERTRTAASPTPSPVPLAHASG